MGRMSLGSKIPFKELIRELKSLQKSHPDFMANVNANFQEAFQVTMAEQIEQLMQQADIKNKMTLEEVADLEAEIQRLNTQLSSRWTKLPGVKNPGADLKILDREATNHGVAL